MGVSDEMLGRINPSGSLLESELDREGEFIDMFMAVLKTIAVFEDPDEADDLSVIHATLVTRELWRYQRLTEDGDALSILDDPKSTVAENRRAAFRDMDDRNRMRSLCLRGLRQTEEMLDTIRKSAKVYNALADGARLMLVGGKE